MTGNKLKIFFMVEPGPLEVQAHLLISSLLVHCKDRFVMEGFCRAERLDGLQKETLEYLAQCDVDLTPITNDFADGYPAGNKLIAANAVTGADWYLFMDTDMVMVRDASIVSQIAQGQVGLCLDTINGWNNEDAQWKLLFGAAGTNPPDEVIPYPHGGSGRAIYNAGLVAFPDAADRILGRFGTQWRANWIPLTLWPIAARGLTRLRFCLPWPQTPLGGQRAWIAFGTTQPSLRPKTKL
jgi:hypothetical protein